VTLEQKIEYENTIMGAKSENSKYKW